MDPITEFYKSAHKQLLSSLQPEVQNALRASIGVLKDMALTLPAYGDDLEAAALRGKLKEGYAQAVVDIERLLLNKKPENPAKFRQPVPWAHIDPEKSKKEDDS